MTYQTLISTDDLAGQLDNPEWVIVDCRFWLDDTEKGRRDYQEAHIPGAIYAHIDEDLSGPVVPSETGRHPLPSVNNFSQKLSSWGVDFTVQVVAYDDRGGAMAARLWWLLKWLGHDAVAVLDGGWPAWQQDGHPTTAEIPVPEPRAFEPHLRPEMVVTAQDVLQRFGDPQYRLVDSRAPERYRGEEEPIDPVAGHIPGAISRPYEDNLEGDGHFRPKSILRGQYLVVLGNVPAEKATFYCGSGVTGAHNVLAVNHAGLGMPRLYAGSWSHWITDPERPISKV